jgi:hypothetical protein
VSIAKKDLSRLGGWRWMEGKTRLVVEYQDKSGTEDDDVRLGNRRCNENLQASQLCAAGRQNASVNATCDLTTFQFSYQILFSLLHLFLNIPHTLHLFRKPSWPVSSSERFSSG